MSLLPKNEPTKIDLTPKMFASNLKASIRL